MRLNRTTVTSSPFINLPPIARAVFLALCALSDEHGFSHPTQKCIAKVAGRTDTQIPRALKQLRDAGMLITTAGTNEIITYQVFNSGAKKC